MLSLILTKPNTAFAELLNLYSVLAGVSAPEATAVPFALTSDAAAHATIVRGMLSPQAVIIAIVALIIILLATLGIAYAKSLALSIIAEIQTNKRATFLSMFRDARKFFVPTLRSLLPYGIFFAAALLFLVPAELEHGAYVLLHGEATPPATTAGSIAIAIIILAWCTRLCTLFSDSAIVGGSQRPFATAVQFARANKATLVVSIIVLSILGVSIFAILLSLGRLQATSSLIIFANIIAFVLYSAYRMFVSAYLVSLGRERSQA